MSAYILPCILLFCVLCCAIRRVPIYSAFIAGAKRGLQNVMDILPCMLCMLCAIGAFRACGLLDVFCGAVSHVFDIIGMPSECVPLMLVRPLSGSGALSLLQDVFSHYGTDTRTGLIASVLMGSGETILYTTTIYLSVTKVRQTRYALPCAFISWFVGSVTAALLF